ncbi:methionyl-tRNA formyltransferase [Bacillaceae bacterium SIJ1]|nr:methionyl-tRNA formyltransferase [Litoribacterium kuwaitense]
MGTPDFSVPILQMLLNQSDSEVVAVVTQPDRPKGRRRVLTPSPVKEEALKHQIPVLQPERIRAEEELKAVLSYEPDLIVTAAYGQLVPKELLDAPPFGCINVHASLLPELRGGAPIHYAIIQQKKETGISIMYMTPKLDAGPVLAQRSIPIEATDHVGMLHDKLSACGAALLEEILPAIWERRIDAQPQIDEEATFAYNISREDEKIDWSQNHRKVEALIRGLHPWPVAYTSVHGQTLKVWWAVLSGETTGESPGTILRITKEGIDVACGDQTVLTLTELQPAGKKRMNATDYARGKTSPLQPGVQLGELY